MSASKSKPTHIYSSISVAIVMFLLGTFVLLLLHSHNLTNIIKEKMNIVAELEKNANSKEVIALMKQQSEIRNESIKYISKSEAIATMSNNLKMDFDDDSNPFSDVVTFNIKSADYDSDVLKKIKLALEKNNNVQSVYYEDLTIQNIKSNLNKVAYVIFSIGLIFVFLAIIIIRNTINLSMYADRWEIKTMELIGAKWGFIKMPYIKTGVLVGFRAFIIAAISIMGLLILVNIYFPNIWEVVNFFYILISLGVIFVLAIVIPAITTNSAADKYLKKNMDALYE
ncbi:MAG: cell division transport system permease protein [Saprospiraceae bacterium]|jgi:cell division transport system permease protein